MALWNRTLTIMYLGLAALGALWVEGWVVCTLHSQFELQAMNRNNQTPFWRFCIWCSIQICKAKLTSNAREIDQSMGKLSWGASWLLPNPSAKGNGIMASWVFCCNCQLRLVAFLLGDVQSWEDLRWEFPMLSIEINSPCHDWIPAQLAIIKDSKTERAWSRTFFSLCCIHSLSTCH